MIRVARGKLSWYVLDASRRICHTKQIKWYKMKMIIGKKLFDTWIFEFWIILGGFFTIRQGNFGWQKILHWKPALLSAWGFEAFPTATLPEGGPSACSDLSSFPRGFLRKNDKRLILKTKQGICKEIHMKIYDFLNTSLFSEWHIFRSKCYLSVAQSTQRIMSWMSWQAAFAETMI